VRWKKKAQTLVLPLNNNSKILKAIPTTRVVTTIKVPPIIKILLALPNRQVSKVLRTRAL